MTAGFCEGYFSLDDLPGEEWRDVPGFEGTFKVSNRGRVKRLQGKVYCINGERAYYRHQRERILSLNSKGRGRLCDGEYSQNYACGILVATVFGLPKPAHARCVLHKDGNKLNNAVENLFWHHAVKVGRPKAPKTKKAKQEATLTAADVRRQRRARQRMISRGRYAALFTAVNNPKSRPVENVTTGKTYPSILEAARDKGYNRLCLARAIKAKGWYKDEQWRLI